MSKNHVKLAPSILSADFARLGEQIAEAEAAGADRIHIDVMDGHFVPNLTMGVPVVKSLRAVTKLPLEVHLMITDPDLFVEAFADAGADTLIVHWEGNLNLHRTLQRIKSLDRRVGLALNPATPAKMLTEILCDVDLVLVMTVNPGFGHQTFIRSMIRKIARVRQLIDDLPHNVDLELDGGIDPSTAPLGVSAGGDVLVAGTAIFGTGEPIADAMDRLRASYTH
ncbi:MAG TPA: ribulose-phosphate 3-epimerase [Pirellulales bacterium]|jgi:ribulose-phosphate 3-epimerase